LSAQTTVSTLDKPPADQETTQASPGSSNLPLDSEIADLTIVGAGPCGLFAAYYAGFREMKTRILDALPEAGGQLTVLYPEKYIFDVPGYPQILARDLVAQLVAQAMRYNPKMVLGERAQQLTRNPDGTYILETDKGRYPTKAILITAGVGSFSPNKLTIPDQEKYEDHGIYYFVKKKDFFRDKNLLIVGGGDSAVDWALNLKDVTRSITLIHRRDQFRAHEQSVKELYSSPQIKVRTFTELKAVGGEDGALKTATLIENKTQKTDTIPVECILVNIGFKANLGPIANWGLEMENRAIKVNGRMETSRPGIFAAGDIAAQTDSVKLNLIATGFAQSALAVNIAKKYVDPKAQLFPGHSSEKSS
jgi:ferredoxin/flavodoxin---NADP+ reductase